MFSIASYLSQIKSASENPAESSQPTEKTSVIVAPTPQKASSTDYTQLIRNNETKARIVQATINETKPLRGRVKNLDLAKPTEDEIRECTEKTKKVIDSILQQRLSTNLSKSDNSKKAEYIRYTSSDLVSGEATSSRIIKIVDAQQDPMAPPKFKQKKQMARPPSPPAPLLHDPSTAKPTKEDQQKWYIPPAVSNWKNPNGFTIALDKRVAVDGRDPTNPGDVGDGEQVSDNFMNLAQALEDADKKAREEIKLRNAMKKRLAEKDNREKEEKLRSLAQRAREERSSYNRITERDESAASGGDVEARKRAILREERRRKAEKELKMSRMGNETKMKTQAKSLLDRDISDRTQLGLAKATPSVENQFDSRLFTNSTQVQNSEDQVYDNPLFVAQGISSIYKVSQSSKNYDPDEQLKDISSEKRFEDVDAGPVEFEKEGIKNKADDTDIEYGLQTKKQKTK
jgi:SNW domain-containing protein 1